MAEDPKVKKAREKQEKYEKDRLETTVSCPEKENMTRAEFGDESDINNIMSKYEKTGSLPVLMSSDPVYADFSTVEDYQTALNTIIVANDQFDALPAAIKIRVGNDPIKFLEFVADEKNYEELVKLGIVEPKKKTEPEKPVEPKPEGTNG